MTGVQTCALPIFKATIGPTVTLYEIVPEAGIRVAAIRKLQDDIALNLSALGIRIIAPMPGKGTIGIEVPRKNPSMVLCEVLFLRRNSKMQIWICQWFSGKPFLMKFSWQI